MERKQNGLVPIGEALADLGGTVQAIRKTPLLARRGFTVADQVNQLAAAREADPDLGFMARTMALCSLPRSNPGNQLLYKRVNGPYRLYMQAGPEAAGISGGRCGGNYSGMAGFHRADRSVGLGRAASVAQGDRGIRSGAA